MRQLTRLLRYAAPYWWQLLSSVILMAAVGLAWDLQVVPERIYEEARATQMRRATASLLGTPEPPPLNVVNVDFVEEPESI